MLSLSAGKKNNVQSHKLPMMVVKYWAGKMQQIKLNTIKKSRKTHSFNLLHVYDWLVRAITHHGEQ